MKFSDIYGHEKIKNILKGAIEANEIGHAYIFEGKSGIGKMSMAEAFASALLCENPRGAVSCGVCGRCKQCEAGSNPDMRVITNSLYDPQKKSNQILIDTVRKMKQEIYVKPFSGDRRVYIIPKAESMNTAAQNSLLKILEEPPAYCTIILIAENSAAFLETVLSRATRLRFSPLSNEEVLKYLWEKKGIDEEGGYLAAAMAEGSIGKALEILDNRELFDIRNQTVDMFCGILNSNYKNVFEFAKFLKQNRNNKDIIFDSLKSFIRDIIYRLEFGEEEGEIVCRDKAKEISEFCRKLQKGAATELMDILLEYSSMIERNVNFSVAAGLMATDFWEVIHDRGNRSQI